MFIQEMTPALVSATRQFLIDNGWAHRIGTEADFANLIKASQYALVALSNEGQVIGFARAISDGLSNGYLSMIAVHSTYRRKGIGTALVQQILSNHEHITWVLRAGREGAEAFFNSLGFVNSSIAMERPRQHTNVK